MFQSSGGILMGLTDLPIAAVAVAFGILLQRRHGGAGGWAKWYFLIGISAVLGATVHIFAWNKTAKNIIWVGLYILLFEAVRRVGLLFRNGMLGKKHREQLWIYLTEVIFYGVTVIGLFKFPFNEIYIFALFAVIIFARLFDAYRTAEKVSFSFKVVFALTAVAIILQLFTGFGAGFVAAEHIVLAAALIVTYGIAARAEKNAK